MNNSKAANSLRFPTSSAFSGQNLKDEFVNWADTECSDGSFHYSLLVSKKCRPLKPQNWFEQTANPFTTCCKFQSPNEEMTLSVGFSIVKRDLNAGDFINALQKHAGEKIINLRRENKLNEGNGDVLSKAEIENDSYIKRTYSIRNADRIFRIQAKVKERHYADWAEEIFVSLASFKLLNPKTNSPVEQTKNIRLEERKLQISFPVSWKFETLDLETGGDNFFRLVSQNEADTSEIFVFAFSAEQSARQAAQVFVSYLRTNNFQVNGFPLITEKTREDAARSSFARSMTQKNEITKELAMVVHEFDNSTALIGLNGTLAETNPLLWTVSKKCFELVCNSISSYAL